MLLFNSKEKPMWSVSPAGSFQMIQLGMAWPGLGDNHRDAGGESPLGNNRYTRAVSKAYKLFRSPCTALKSDLHKSLECLTEFVKVPALSAPQTRRTTLLWGQWLTLPPTCGPQVVFPEPDGPMWFVY